MKKIYLLIVASVFGFYQSNGQCNPGEVEMELTIHSGTYAYEGYWELVPGTNACGTGTIVSGGNNAVGCSGGGAKAVTSGGYADNQVITVPIQCLTQSNAYTLKYRDDWGDGGFEFEVAINGYTIKTFKGTGASQNFSFVAEEPLQYNLEALEMDKPYGYAQQNPAPIEAHFFNLGRDTVTSLTFAYQVNNNPAVSATMSGLSIANYKDAHISHTTSWTPAANGVYSIKLWVSQINGNTDMDATNDTILKQVEIGPATINIIDSYLAGLNKVTQIGNASDQLNGPTDLDFHPTLSRKELWVVNKRNETSGGSTITYYNAGTSTQTDVHKKDGNSWHFMSLPTGIAFSENENFGTSPGVYDANHNGGAPFTGPALWSSDPAIYAQPSGGNGSHYDMLHESPECQGIAHEKDNVFWVFDGYNDDIVRYDFAAEHVPGGNDHADGIIWRYSEVNVDKDPNNKVVSHLVYDKATDLVYVVDYGNKRVIRIDATTGTKGGAPNFGPHEPVAEYKNVVNYTWETVADSGLVEPAGIDVIDNRMLVSDYATGHVIIYDITTMPAKEMGRLSTGAQGIMGIKIGPDGAIWYVDYDANTVNRIDLSSIGLEEKLASTFDFYPNPSNGQLTLKRNNLKDQRVKIHSATGQLLFTQVLAQQDQKLQLDFLPAGIYTLSLTDDRGKLTGTKPLIISE